MKKVISILVVLIMLISSIEVFASGTNIECMAETIDGVSYISGKILGVSGFCEVSLLVGDADNISEETVYYIDKTDTNANGEFSFTFKFPGGTPSGTYEYHIGTNAGTGRYDGTIKYTNPDDYMINQFVDADLAVSISGYVPTISGSISCAYGKTVAINVLNKTDNSIIAEETIVSEDGYVSVSCALPNLLLPKEYEVVIECTEENKEIMRAYTTIKSSGLTLDAYGGITPAENVEIDMRLKTEGIDLVNKNKKITEAETFTESIPNIVAIGSVNLNMQGYELVWIDREDTDDNEDGGIDGEPEQPGENEDDNKDNEQTDTVVAKNISGDFEGQDEIRKIENNSFDGSRNIVDNCYSGKFALEIKQHSDKIMPILESDYFYMGNPSTKAGAYIEKANLILINVKPMYKAETISFYTKAKVKRDGETREEYVRIKSDKNGDGVFKIGEDLSLGKWQELELSLDTIEEDIVNKSVSGLYMRSNANSTWLFDEINSDYRKINSEELDLSKFAKGSVVNNGGLRFSSTDGKYNTEPTIVTSGINIDDQLHNIAVNSHIQSNGQLEEIEMGAETTETRDLLFDAKFSAEDWIVNDTDYESSAKYVSKFTGDGIVLKRLGSAELKTGTFTTKERVKIVLGFSFIDGVPSSDPSFDVDLYEAGEAEPYYTFSRSARGSRQSVEVSGIMPQIRENTQIKITASITTGFEIRLESLKLYSLCKSDWNAMNKYNARLAAQRVTPGSYHSSKSVKELPGYIGNEGAIFNKDIVGVVKEDSRYMQSVNTKMFKSGGFFVIRMVNLSEKEQTFEVDYTEYTLPFGENDIITKYGEEINLPLDENVMLVSICQFSDTNEDKGLYYSLIEGMSDNYIISYNGERIYYTNYLEGDAIYKYDIAKRESAKVAGKAGALHCVSNDERYIVYGNKIYDTQEGTETELPDGYKYSFNARGELFYVAEDDNENDRVFKYNNGAEEQLFSGDSYAFDNSGNYVAVRYKKDSSEYIYTLYKYYNGSYTATESFELTRNYTINYLLDDLSAVYTSGGLFDLKTGESLSGFGPIFKAKDGTFITEDMQLYNPATGESYKITDATGEVVHYNPDTGILTIVDGGYIARCKFTAEKSSAKYLLSFDGKNTWQSYKNGRWVTISKGKEPTEAEIAALGMTGDELNNISPAAYKKLYTNGTDILRVDIAIYMNSTSNKLTPVISKITVSTSENVSIRQMFSVRKEMYNRADYANVTSIFPVEDFKESSECYYLFHLGKDKLYTYKGNELVEITETEEELLGDMERTWIKFKQYAMSAKELRNVPADALSNLFLNPESAHTEFGVVYVLKGTNNDANTVTFKIQANAKHINSTETVIEVMMNGGDKKIIDSREFNTESIEKFLSWLEDRQAGKGATFYIFKNGEVQFFINYYMIDSINVYDAEKYITDVTEEQSVVVEE